MSHPAPNTSLSTSARLLCYLGPPSAILLTSLSSPQTAIFSFLTFLPTACFFQKWRSLNNTSPSRRGELEPLLWTYTLTGTIGLGACALLQLISAYLTSTLLFGSSSDFLTELVRSSTTELTAPQLLRRASLANSWQNWLFNLTFTFLMAGLIEESVKYVPIMYARHRDRAKRRNRAYLDYAVAGALGFGLVENLGFLYASRAESWPKLARTLVERVSVSAVGHLLVGLLTALRAVRRDYYGDDMSWWGVVGPSVLLHGTFDFVALSFSALEGNVGWIHPTGVRNITVMFGLLGGLVATAARRARREWMMLEDLDRRAKQLR